MDAREGPTGQIVTPEDERGSGDELAGGPPGAGRAGWFEEWLRPGRRRVWSAALVVAASVVSFVVSAVALGEFHLIVSGYETRLALYLVPVLTRGLLVLALAAFLLAGSRAARVLAAGVAVAGLLELVLPLWVFGTPMGSLGLLLVPYAAAALLYVATLVALVVPRASGSGGLDARPSP